MNEIEDEIEKKYEKAKKEGSSRSFRLPWTLTTGSASLAEALEQLVDIMNEVGLNRWRTYHKESKRVIEALWIRKDLDPKKHMSFEDLGELGRFYGLKARKIDWRLKEWKQKKHPDEAVVGPRDGSTAETYWFLVSEPTDDWEAVYDKLDRLFERKREKKKKA
jgi:hypothetical protein